MSRLARFCLCAIAMIGISAMSTAYAGKNKQPTSAPADENGPLKFYGTISAVDAKAMTFTVDNQTFTIVPETHMTKAADDSQATIADAVVGETVRGTYTKSADGKLQVTKVRFGKKAGGGKKSGKKNQEPASKPS